MSTKPAQVRNASIDLFRYICAIMVVCIHTGPFSESFPQLSDFMKNIFPRIAVPFFFGVSGYFYIKKLEAGTARFLPYIMRLLSVYSIWSCLYFAMAFLEWGHSNLRKFLVSAIGQFFITGSSEHFWFFPALIISIGLVTLLYKLRLQKIMMPLSLICYAIGCFSCAYYNIFWDIPFFNALFSWTHYNTLRRILFMGFPFFASGYLTIRIETAWKCRKKTSILWYFAALLFWAGEIWFVSAMHFFRSYLLTFGLYLLVLAVMLVLLQHPMGHFQKASTHARAIANFTYYSHPFFLSCLSYSSYLFTGQDMSSTGSFFLCLVITFICGYLLSRWNNRIVKLVLV